MEKSSNFATDLTFGEQSEKWVKDIFCCNDGTIEVKTERDIWLNTGNITFEIESRGKPSGITNSTSTQWIEVFKSNDRFISAMIFETEVLRQWVLRGNFEKKRGGDNNTSVLLIVPIKDLFNFYTKEFQMEFDNTNRGSIWANKNKESETHPDFKGSLNVDGVEYWVNAWKRKEGANPKAPALAFSIQKKEPKPESAPAQTGGFEDPIPF